MPHLAEASPEAVALTGVLLELLAFTQLLGRTPGKTGQNALAYKGIQKPPLA